VNRDGNVSVEKARVNFGTPPGRQLPLRAGLVSIVRAAPTVSIDQTLAGKLNTIIEKLERANACEIQGHAYLDSACVASASSSPTLPGVSRMNVPLALVP
jgi:hypothetical protein